jgi:hypothetical protein
LDVKAYAAFKDRGRKESVRRVLRNECMVRGLDIGINPADVDRLEQLAITKSILVNNITKDNYRNTLVNLMDMWRFLMSQFEQHDISGANFNPADYI